MNPKRKFSLLLLIALCFMMVSSSLLNSEPLSGTTYDSSCQHDDSCHAHDDFSPQFPMEKQSLLSLELQSQLQDGNTFFPLYNTDELWEEMEPNDTIAQANDLRSFRGVENWIVVGSITGSHADLDYYKMDVQAYGTIVAVGYWADAFFNMDQEADLCIELVLPDGTVAFASQPMIIEGEMYTVLAVSDVPPGIYYIRVRQTHGPTNRYVGETYVFFLDFIIDPCILPPPPAPTGPTDCSAGNTYHYHTVGTSCSQPHNLTYRFAFGDGRISNFYNDKSESHRWMEPGVYEVRVQARCGWIAPELWEWSEPLIVTVNPTCVIESPLVFTEAPASGEILEPLTFSFEPVVCSNGHSLEYYFRWDDWTSTSFGTATTATKAYDRVGTYEVKAIARCPHSYLTPHRHSEPHSVTITAPLVDLVIVPNLPEGGSFTGDGSHMKTSFVPVEAFPNPGFVFHRWLSGNIFPRRTPATTYYLEDEMTVHLQFRQRLQAERIFGSNRIMTSIEVSRTGWEDDSTDHVLIARSHDFADALAGVPLAYALNAPILLTSSHTVSAATLTEIQRLGASQAILLGGTGALSEQVADLLAAQGLQVERIAGSNRFATAAAIADRLEAEIGPLTDAVIAIGTSFPDALSSAAHAAIRGQPILLVRQHQLPSPTSEALANLNIQNLTVIGGTNAVNSTVMDSLTVPGTKTRVFSDNRYTTAVAVAEHFHAGATNYYLATGTDFPDAITGAVLAAKQGTAVLLVYGPSSAPPVSVQDFLVDHLISEITLFGGSSVISNTMQSWF